MAFQIVLGNLVEEDFFDHGLKKLVVCMKQ
jgi:hypothetical protein